MTHPARPQQLAQTPPLATRSAVWPRLIYAGVLLAGPVLFVLFVKFGPPAYTSDPADDVWFYSLIAWLLAMIAGPVIGLVDAVRKFAIGDADGLRKGAITIKLAGIPLFVTNFVLVAGIALFFQFLASMWAGGAVLAVLNWAGVGLMVGLTYLVMLPTSAYGWACLIWLRRHNTITNTFLVANALLHAIFVVDIISSLIVAAKVRETLAGTAHPRAAP